MVSGSQHLLLCLAIILFSFKAQSENGMKTGVFLSPKFELEPGSVANKYYYNIDFPKGHIAIKSFNAEVIDEKGNPIPLHETYLHHWIVVGYYVRKGINNNTTINHRGDMELLQSDYALVRNSGLCDHGLVQYFGLGSETRRTSTDVPNPYGIEVGKQEDVPTGYEELWMLNVHAIDTRNARDKMGCTECRCDLYNVTVDETFPANYTGGLRCCHDGARCSVREGFDGVKRGLFLKYTVTYMDWDASIIPVQIYILDVTDIWTKGDSSRGLKDRHQCLIEYDVEACPMENDGCIHTRSLTASLPSGGDVIYGVGHQHAGGLGSTLYGEGGRVICSSVPTYGSGDAAGNEAGYIVGMSTCYPSPGCVKISAGETLTLVSNYSSAQRHTGVMALFYLLIADSQLKPNAISEQMHGRITASHLGWAIALFGVGSLLALVIIRTGRNGRDEQYEEI